MLISTSLSLRLLLKVEGEEGVKFKEIKLKAGVILVDWTFLRVIVASGIYDCWEELFARCAILEIVRIDFAFTVSLSLLGLLSEYR